MRDKIPFYIEQIPPGKKRPKKNKTNYVDVVNAVGSWVIKILALGGSFALALYYDGQWIYVFFAMALVLLGVELKTKFMNGGLQ